jgi:predicted ribosome quality control (RQC) complex YloA/Tae2 family protein
MMQETNTPPITIEALKHEALHLHSVCRRALKRIRKKLEKQEEDEREASAYPWFTQMADSLLAHPDAVKRGASVATVENIHSQSVEKITLDPERSVFENARELYRRARKGKRGLEIIRENIRRTKREEQDFSVTCIEAERLAAPDGVRQGTEALSASIEAVRVKLQERGALPRTTPLRDRTAGETVPYRHLIIDGWNIYIGKNDAQNDELSTRFAKPWDIWMHVAAHAGSHIVIRRDKNAGWPPRDILLKVAAFAVWFSKAKHTSYAEVHVTEARFVRKRRHAPPGEVIAERCKTLRVSPKSPQEFFGESEENAR